MNAKNSNILVKENKRTKFNKIVATLGIVLIIGIALGIVSYPHVKNYIERQNRYGKAIQLIKEQNWEESQKYLVDESILTYYVKAKVQYEKRDIGEANKLLDNIAYTYNGYLKDDILNFKGKVNAEYGNIKKEEEKQRKAEEEKQRQAKERKEDLDNISKMLDNGEYEKVYQKQFDTSYIYLKDGVSYAICNNDMEYETLFNYAHARSFSSDVDVAYYLTYISPDYNGIYSEKIINYSTKIFGSKEKWNKEYLDMQSIIKAQKERDKLPNPSIGMTATEVRLSKWGSPNDINRTTTAYSVHEQWCYSGNKYIYLENGVVTSIQD